MSNTPTPVTVLYDPLCGFCYGAAPTLRKLHEHREYRLRLVPTGLFSGAGSRPLDAGFAQFAWANDQRIEAMTGQHFSKRYQDDVLGALGTRLDSGPATRALTAVASTSSMRELDALEAIQRARYVDGRDVTDLAVLVDVLRALGLEESATRLGGGPDAELDAAIESRTSTARGQLVALGARGVPTVIVGEPTATRLIPSDRLYGPFARLHDELRLARSPFLHSNDSGDPS